MSIAALIPARGGSKRVPRKNMALCAGKPLLSWTIEAALASRRLDRILLSTDDAEIAALGREAGIDVVMRPAELARDGTPMIPVIQHALSCLAESGLDVEGLVLLQPTSPLRTARHIDEAVTVFCDGGAESLVSVVELAHIHHPIDAHRITEHGLESFFPEAVTAPLRADPAPAYARNGPAILIGKPAVFERGEKFGRPLLPYVMTAQDSVDIDEPFDLALAELLLERRASMAVAAQA